jgi:hypothetical protein
VVTMPLRKDFVEPSLIFIKLQQREGREDKD